MHIDQCQVLSNCCQVLSYIYIIRTLNQMRIMCLDRGFIRHRCMRCRQKKSEGNYLRTTIGSRRLSR